jgi:hypothetical protein
MAVEGFHSIKITILAPVCQNGDFMKYIYLCLPVLLLLGVNGCGTKINTSNQKLLYSFIEEIPEKTISERVVSERDGHIFSGGHIPPIDEPVLLFPVITKGVVNGKHVNYGLGSPVLYNLGTDVNTLKFKGIECLPVRRYVVWARGYYVVTIPRMFTFADTFEGQEYTLVQLTPIKPGTDQQKMDAAIINELKKGKIVVEDGILNIAEVTDYARLIRAEELRSWIIHPGNFQDQMVLWGLPGATVEILLTPDDYTLIESYLRGAPSTNSPAR